MALATLEEVDGLGARLLKEATPRKEPKPEGGTGSDSEDSSSSDSDNGSSSHARTQRAHATQETPRGWSHHGSHHVSRACTCVLTITPGGGAGHKTGGREQGTAEAQATSPESNTHAAESTLRNRYAVSRHDLHRRSAGVHT